jgi:signal transduction histidine kinase
VSGLDQIQYLSWIVYIVIFVAVLVRTIRRPTPAHFDMTLFFGAVAAVIVIVVFAAAFHLSQAAWVGAVSGGLLVALGYFLLRLVRDFSRVPLVVMRAAEAAVVLTVVMLLALPTPLPTVPALLLVAYLVLSIAYSTYEFFVFALRTRGVTRRRLQAAALGSLCFALVLLLAGLALVLPDFATLINELGAVAGLGSAICYFVAFAPPNWLKRAWAEPELRAFLARATTLARVGDLRAAVQALEGAAADALGAPLASIALWNPETQRLHVYAPSEIQTEDVSAVERDWDLDPSEANSAARPFVEQRACLISDPGPSTSDGADVFELYGAQAVLGAPITTAYGKRLGALLVYAQRAPMFANSDLELVQLLADQAGSALETRALIEEQARVRAREEAARLKEDFLSSAAHDLKTPLTGIVTQAQVLMRRVERDPSAPADRTGLNRLMTQSLRLRDLVLELLDVSRLEQGGLIGERTDTDLVALVRAAIARDGARWKRVALSCDGPVVAAVDSARFDQVVTNLIENALKYSPNATPVHVRVWEAEGEARLSVVDQGIGIPIEDQPLIFERFHRARNVDDRRFAGMGLGLYISRGIVVEHGGRIWVESTPGSGSTFCVAIPLNSPSDEQPSPA